MKEAVLVYPHQLFKAHPALRESRQVYLIEDPLYFTQYRFHKQKLILHRASMQAYAAALRGEGYAVHYLDYIEATEPLSTWLRANGIQTVHVAEVTDTWLKKKIVREAASAQVALLWHETPQFLTSQADVYTYWSSKKRHLQHHFYVWQRKRLGVLVNDGAPEGGVWSFDKENRDPLPEDQPLPKAYRVPMNEYVREAIEYVEKHFPNNYGMSEPFRYGVTHEEAEQCLAQFLEERFALFGKYEDAISERGHELFHSVLSPYLNTGLLTPEEVLQEALAYAKAHTIPLPSLEGFVRQLIGWREYIRMVYECDGTRMRNQNVLEATHNLTRAWWDGTTGVVPVDHAIATLKAHAYTHHIVRLMVLGNAMTLLGVKPDEAYTWFMEWYIDAYDWVMVPNVYGMALFADGGSMVTKPYVSSSRYLLKMSDYPKGHWTLLWDGLYWAFISRHEAFLAQNRRVGFAVATLRRLAPATRAAHMARAEEARSLLTRQVSD